MLTTLRTGALTLDIPAQYKFTAADKKLTIKLTSDGNHKLYGDVKIALSNAEVISIKKKDGTQIADYFNRTLKFTKTSATTLEYSEIIESGIAASEIFIDLPDAAGAVEAEIDNLYVDLLPGKYDFFLLDTADMVFSTSTVGVKYLDIANSGENGIESNFDEEGEGDLLSINNQTLTFSYATRISISSDVSGTTNIPLVING